MPGAGAAWAREDGSVLFYPACPAEGGRSLPLEGDRLPLAFVDQGPSAMSRTRSPTRIRAHPALHGQPVPLGPYWLNEIEDRNGNAYRISRTEDGLPVLVTTTPATGCA